MRIGIGNDLHRLIPGKPLLLGGVEIDSPTGPLAHSDGDVLIHAIIDALLGAAGMGDIGELFPPDDERWAGASGRSLLCIVQERVESAGFFIEHIDTVIHLEKPSLRSCKGAIADNLADILKIPPTAVSVKAKSGEGLGPVGEGLAISAEAAVLLNHPEPDIWV